MADAVRVKGLRELNRAFSKMSKETKKELRGELQRAAEPVRRGAEENTRILGPAWSRMRVGVKTSAVYVAPAARRKGGSPRPNAGVILLRGMDEALEDKRGEVLGEVDKMLGRLGGDAGF
jgi:hypothetical protein